MLMNAGFSKRRLFIITIGIIFVLIIWFIFAQFNVMKDENRNDFIADDVPHYFSEIESNSELEDLIENQQGEILLYFSRSDCLYCETYLELIEKAYEKNKEGFKTIYYYNTKKQYELDEKTDTYLVNLDISTVPALVKVNNGKVISKIDNALNVNDIEGFINSN